MAKNKYSIHINPGECCIVVPTDWARHIIASYKQMAINADTREDSQAFQEFVEAIQTWVEETSVVDYYE